VDFDLRIPYYQEFVLGFCNASYVHTYKFSTNSHKLLRRERSTITNTHTNLTLYNTLIILTNNYINQQMQIKLLKILHDT